MGRDKRDAALPRRGVCARVCSDASIVPTQVSTGRRQARGTATTFPLRRTGHQVLIATLVAGAALAPSSGAATRHRRLAKQCACASGGACVRCAPRASQFY